MPAPGPFAAIVLAGGRGARLGGAEKALLELDGRRLLDHALAALADAETVVVVGDRVPTSRRVVFVREEPRYAGPVAALLAGRDALPATTARALAVLAVDMPRVDRATLGRLREAAQGRDGAFLADPEGRRQLAGVLDIARLDAVRPAAAQAVGMAWGRVLAGLDLDLVEPRGAEARDVDSWADLRALGGDPGPGEV